MYIYMFIHMYMSHFCFLVFTFKMLRCICNNKVCIVNKSKLLPNNSKSLEYLSCSYHQPNFSRFCFRNTFHFIFIYLNSVIFVSVFLRLLTTRLLYSSLFLCISNFSLIKFSPFWHNICYNTFLWWSISLQHFLKIIQLSVWNGIEVLCSHHLKWLSFGLWNMLFYFNLNFCW